MYHWGGWVLAESYRFWSSYAGAIVLAALAFNVVISPLIVRQIRSARAHARLNERYRNDPATLKRESARLFAEYKVHPGTAVLLLLLNVAAVALLYEVLTGLEAGGGPKYVAHSTALWESLTHHGGRLMSMGIDLTRSIERTGHVRHMSYVLLGLLFLLVATLVFRHAFLARRRGRVVLPVAKWWVWFWPPLIVASLIPVWLFLYVLTSTLFRFGLEILVYRQPRRERRRHRPPAAPPKRTLPPRVPVVPPRPPTPTPVIAAPPPPTPKPVRKLQVFRDATRAADQLASQGNALGSLAARVEATRVFVRSATEGDLAKAAAPLKDDPLKCPLKDNLVQIVSAQPKVGVELFAVVRRRAPDVAVGLSRAVLDAWAESEAAESMAADGSALEEFIAGATGSTLPADLTCRIARRLVALADVTLSLDSKLGPELPVTDVPPLVKAIGHLDVDGRQLTVGEIYCLLGDRARTGERRREAVGRYRIAVTGGCVQARPRLAYCLAVEGHLRLVDGDLEGARARLDEALQAHDDPGWRLLVAITDIIEARGESTDTKLLARLEGLGEEADRSTVAFWKAIVHLRHDRPDRAAQELRFHVQRDEGAGGSWTFADEAAVLLASLEGDDDTLVACADRLLRAKQEAWLEEGPVDPWPMLAAVARHDLRLLADLCVLLPDAEMPEWARLAVAHALLGQALALTGSGSLPEALHAAARASLLLGGG